MLSQPLLAGLNVSAHLMTLDAGLFCLFQTGAAREGDGLPGVRISLPPGEMDEDAVVICGFRQDGWLAPQGDAALVRVRRGPARIMVTIYQAPDGDAPRLQVMRLGGDPDGGPGGDPGGALMPHELPAREGATPAACASAFIQERDVAAPWGLWAGVPGAGRAIEGVMIAPHGLMALDQIEYQAQLGPHWYSPWTAGGRFCGSRGMGLPLLGLRVRLRGEAAAHWACRLFASFADGTRAGPLPDGELACGEDGAALEAFRLELVARDAG